MIISSYLNFIADLILTRLYLSLWQKAGHCRLWRCQLWFMIPRCSFSQFPSTTISSPHRTLALSKRPTLPTAARLLPRCMQISPSQTSNKKSSKKQSRASQPNFPAQDGFNLLLSPQLPADALSWITSYLYPQHLFSLSRVSKHLAAHVALDSTWRIAFWRCFFDLDPETSIDVLCQVLLRRSERTWRTEFIKRFNSV